MPRQKTKKFVYVPNARRTEREAEIDKIVGDRLIQLRGARDITQMGLSTTLGVSFQQVQKYENGVNRIAASRLISICDALDAPPSFFLNGLTKGSPLPHPDAHSAQTLRLLAAFSRLSDAEQLSIIDMAEAIANTRKASAEQEPVPA